MKIFNWMRSRFTDEKGKSVENVKKDEEINGNNNDYNNDDNDNGNDNYNKCLLNDHQINEQWRGGYLLTIGTLGVLDPLKHYYMNQEPKQCPNHYNILDKDIEIMDEDEDEDKDKDKDEDDEISQEINYDDGVVCINDDDQTAALIKTKKMDGDGDDDVIMNLDDEIINDDQDIMMKKGRITLADLFNAESAGILPENMSSLPPPPPPPEIKPATSPPPPPPGKELKKKKLSSTSVKKISQPIQKLVKKMLKRKIHPDVEGRNKANNIPLQTIGITS